MLERALRNLVCQAQHAGLGLHRSYARKAPQALLMVNRYARARQMKRKCRETRRLKMRSSVVTSAAAIIRDCIKPRCRPREPVQSRRGGLGLADH